MDKNKPIINIKLLNKTYAIKCTNHNADSLSQAAQILNKKLTTTRDQYQINDITDLALIVALNLCHDLLEQDPQHSPYCELIETQLQTLNKKIQHHLEDAGYT